jgi:hypothetical protein
MFDELPLPFPTMKDSKPAHTEYKPVWVVRQFDTGACVLNWVKKNLSMKVTRKRVHVTCEAL